MTLPTNFPISASQINVELGRASGAQITLGGTAERALAGVPTGAISMSNFLGKSSSGFGISETDFFVDQTGRATYTATGVSFGAADDTREIFIAGAIGDNDNNDANIDNITIGGVTVNQAALDQPNIGVEGVFFFTAHVPLASGTSGNIVIELNESVLDCSLSVFRVVNRTNFNNNTNTIYWDWPGTNSTSISLGQNFTVGQWALGGVMKGNTNAVTLGSDFTKVRDIVANGWTFTSGILLPVGSNSSYSLTGSWSGSADRGASFNQFQP